MAGRIGAVLSWFLFDIDVLITEGSITEPKVL